MVLPFPVQWIALFPGLHRASAQTVLRNIKKLRMLRILLVVECAVVVARVVTPKPFSGFAELLLAFIGIYASVTCIPLYLMLYSLGAMLKALLSSLSLYQMANHDGFGYEVKDPDDGYYYHPLYKYHDNMHGFAHKAPKTYLGSEQYKRWQVYTEVLLNFLDVFVASYAGYVSWHLYKVILDETAEELDQALERINSADNISSEGGEGATENGGRLSHVAFKAFTGEGYRLGSLIGNGGTPTPSA